MVWVTRLVIGWRSPCWVSRSGIDPFQAEALVLPFTKRTARDDGEVINTGEIEILRSKSNGLRAPRAYSPQAAAADVARASYRAQREPVARQGYRDGRVTADDEPTRMVPRSTGPVRHAWAPAERPTPYAPSRATPHVSPSRDDDEATIVRASTISPFPSARAAEARARAAKVSGAQDPISPDSIPPMSMPAHGNRGNAVGTVITNRVRGQGRPTAMWAAALVAMGLFAGLASSVLARGDADSIIDATASFVDPARAGGTRASAPAAAAQVAVVSVAAPAPSPISGAVTGAAVSGPAGFVPALVPAFVPSGATAAAPASNPVASNPAPPPSTGATAATGATVSANDLPIAHPAPAAARVAQRAAVRHLTRTPAKVVATHQEAKEAKEPAAEAADAPEAKPEPKPAKVAKAAKGAKGRATDDDVAAAAAADELARAQLEAALR
jgi:hypothetical protein